MQTYIQADDFSLFLFLVRFILAIFNDQYQYNTALNHQSRKLLLFHNLYYIVTDSKS